MSDLGDFYRELNCHKKANRESNRINGLRLLKEHGVLFTTNNGGVHCMINHKGERIDYWPATGKWVYQDKHERGVFSLLKFLGKQE